MENEPGTITISEELLDMMVNELVQRPYREVVEVFSKLSEELAPPPKKIIQV